MDVDKIKAFKKEVPRLTTEQMIEVDRLMGLEIKKGDELGDAPEPSLGIKVSASLFSQADVIRLADEKV